MTRSAKASPPTSWSTRCWRPWPSREAPSWCGRHPRWSGRKAQTWREPRTARPAGRPARTRAASAAADRRARGQRQPVGRPHAPRRSPSRWYRARHGAGPATSLRDRRW